jgi:hypothetical protein
MPYGPQPEAALTVTERGLEADGLSIGSECDLESVSGPAPGQLGARGIGGGEIELELPEPVGERGTIAFWVKCPAAIMNGEQTRGGGPTFFELPGLMMCNLWWYSGYCQFNFRFTEDGGPNQNIQLPGVPGPQWMHFCFSWDAEEGILQAYVNGTPTRLPGVTVPSWETGRSKRIKLTVGAWAVSDLRLYEDPLDHPTAESIVPPLYRGALDALLGAQPRGELDTRRLRGDLVYENALDSPETTENWRMEGPGIVRHEEGWMHMESAEPDSQGNTGHIVHWCDEDFPADFLCEFEIQPESEHGLVILFFCAKGCEGKDIFDPSLAERTGIFGHYTGGDIDSYHVSYYANTPGAGQGRCTSNLRKNSGFYLVDQGPIGIPPASRDVHEVAVLKRGARVEVAVDGRRLIRWFDPGDRYGPVLGEGKIGFRQMKWMQARYRNLRVWAV